MELPLGIKRIATLIILRNEGRFLLLKRWKEPNKDQYTPVGGKLDPFENPKDAAIRETFEETGIRVSDLKFCGILAETSPTKYNWLSYVYLADIEFQDAPPCNEGILTWIPIENLLNVPTPKTDWYIYQYVLQGKPFVFSAVYTEALELIQMEEELAGKLVI